MRLTTLITICMGIMYNGYLVAAQVPEPPLVRGKAVPSGASPDHTDSYMTSEGSSSSESTPRNTENVSLPCKLNGRVISVESYSPENWTKLKEHKQILTCPRYSSDMNYSDFLENNETFIYQLNPKDKSIIKFQIALVDNLGYAQGPFITGFSYDEHEYQANPEEVDSEVRNWILQFTLIAKQFQFANLNTKQTLKNLVDQAVEVCYQLSKQYEKEDSEKAFRCKFIAGLFKTGLDKLLLDPKFKDAITSAPTVAPSAAPSSVFSRLKNYWLGR